MALISSSWRRRTPASRTARRLVGLPAISTDFPSFSWSRSSVLAVRVVDLVEETTDFLGTGLARSMAPILWPRPLAAEPRGTSKNLADVHPGRHASGFSTMSTGVPSSMCGMSSTGRMRNDTLVTVTAGHLVARLQAALDGHIDLDHLLHARRQFVALVSFLRLASNAMSSRFCAPAPDLP